MEVCRSPCGQRGAVSTYVMLQRAGDEAPAGPASEAWALAGQPRSASRGVSAISAAFSLGSAAARRAAAAPELSRESSSKSTSTQYLTR